jgi:hypothetical protein
MRTVVALACVVVLALGFSATAAAFDPPGYFDGEHVGFLCLRAPVPGFGGIFTLVQINFDHQTGGGISLSEADTLFALLVLGLTESTGPPICKFTPTQLNAQGFDALSAANFVLPRWEDAGWQIYFIMDAFKTTRNLAYIPGLTSNTLIVRGDVFVAEGTDLAYAGAAEVLRSFLGL